MDTAPNPSTNPVALPELTLGISARWALRWQHFVVCLGFVAVYLHLAYLPLFHAVTWRHVSMGEWILSHRALPDVEPFLPLSDGFRVAHTSWLSEVLFSTIWRTSGVQGLSCALTLLTLGWLILTARVFHLRSGRKRLALLGTAFVFV